MTHKPSHYFQTEEITVTCEILKVLFNLYIQSDDIGIEDQEKHRSLVLILYKLLILKYPMQQDDLERYTWKSIEKTYKRLLEEILHVLLCFSNVINLLTVISYNCYAPIVQPVEYNDRKSVYRGMDMSAICVLLGFLDQRLNCKTHLIENISPVVTALIRLVKSETIIRKYVRLQVSKE